MIHTKGKYLHTNGLNMQILTVSSKRDHIQNIYRKYGTSPIPARELKESLGPDTFKDLKGLRHIRKSGYISTCGTFSPHRTSSRDILCFEVTEAGIEALDVSYRMDSCPPACRDTNPPFKRCKRCLKAISNLSHFRGDTLNSMGRAHINTTIPPLDGLAGIMAD